MIPSLGNNSRVFIPVKNDTRIDVPMNLDVAPVMVGASGSPVEYILDGALLHQGATPFSGHYNSVRLVRVNGELVDYNGAPLCQCLNDSTVVQTPYGPELADLVNTTSYMLFYSVRFDKYGGSNSRTAY